MTTNSVKLHFAGCEGSMDAPLQKAPRPNGRSRARPRATDQRTRRAERLDRAELNGHLGYLLRRLQLAVFKDFIRTLAPMKVRPAQYSVLIVIKANPGRSQAAIGQTLGIERARLARLLHRLERRKWVERRAAASDARSHSLFLTDAGEKALRRIRMLADRHERQVAAHVGAERRNSLMAALRDFA
jgi:DNA-binding MarR family transcriptional regulator